MRIKEILSQHRRDFTAIYECEHCWAKEKGWGYDDYNYHVNVIPNRKCDKCWKTAKEDYIPRETKYPEWFII